METYENSIPVTEQVSWTLSLVLIQQLGNLLQQATYYFLKGDIENAFFRLKAVRMRIIQNLKEKSKDKERTKCFEIETEFSKNKIIRDINSDGIINNADKRKIKENQMRLYENYNTLIMDLLEKYGYLIRKREDNTRISI